MHNVLVEAETVLLKATLVAAAAAVAVGQKVGSQLLQQLLHIQLELLACQQL
jgi:hypothetical protein